MNNKIYDKIDVLVIKTTYDTAIPSTNKIEFFNTSITLSGNYIIFNTHDRHDTQKYESTPYHLDKIKGYKTS
jgi:hypothetical protein